VRRGLRGTAVASTQVSLAWSASTGGVGVAGYTVYLNGVALATTAGTSFQHTGLTPGMRYSYRVSAFDAAGNSSAMSAAASVRTRRMVRADFDGHGKSDHVWPNVPTGHNAMGLIGGA